MRNLASSSHLCWWLLNLNRPQLGIACKSLSWVTVFTRLVYEHVSRRLSWLQADGDSPLWAALLPRQRVLNCIGWGNQLRAGNSRQNGAFTSLWFDCGCDVTSGVGSWLWQTATWNCKPNKLSYPVMGAFLSITATETKPGWPRSTENNKTAFAGVGNTPRELLNKSHEVFVPQMSKSQRPAYSVAHTVNNTLS